jgi:hypothetical protein
MSAPQKPAGGPLPMQGAIQPCVGAAAVMTPASIALAALALTIHYIIA